MGAPDRDATHDGITSARVTACGGRPGTMDVIVTSLTQRIDPFAPRLRRRPSAAPVGDDALSAR
ncbi:hypothetical protein FFA01_07210 [Frigoribacterium faeni]|uniref:Uncharacterized protein n=1 Tax=Frigoribacterium faeni TaxID=145483 RepID=A0ABQ0ULP3_9MICO|nr:hypothetical protein FFA01_07210 [Frigoribacterium faeni]